MPFDVPPDAGIMTSVSATLGLLWMAAAVYLGRRDPSRRAMEYAGALALGAGASLAAGVATIPAAIAILWTAMGLAAQLRPVPWARRAGIAFAAAGAAAGLSLLFAPAWTAVAFAVGGAFVLRAVRPWVAFAAVARTALAAACAAVALVGATWLGAESGVLFASAAGTAVLGVALVEWRWPRLKDWPSRRRSPLPPAPGDVLLSRYRVTAPLGAGATGSTHRAVDEVEGGDVAVKWITRAGIDDTAVLREVGALRLVDHKNVIRLMDSGSDPVHGTVLVMPFVEGGSLADRLKDGAALRSPEFSQVALGLLDALAAVHAAGLVHQDVKPANILLDRTGGVRLADFGIARLPGMDTTAGATLTKGPVGTLRYMSPEQAKGRRATPASDVYAAGVTLYEALTGDRWLDFAPEEQYEDALEKAARPPPFDRPLREPGFAPLFACALAARAHDRFEDAAVMRSAFAKVLSQHRADGTGVDADPAPESMAHDGTDADAARVT